MEFRNLAGYAGGSHRKEPESRQRRKNACSPARTHCEKIQTKLLRVCLPFLPQYERNLDAYTVVFSGSLHHRSGKARLQRVPCAFPPSRSSRSGPREFAARRRLHRHRRRPPRPGNASVRDHTLSRREQSTCGAKGAFSRAGAVRPSWLARARIAMRVWTPEHFAAQPIVLHE